MQRNQAINHVRQWFILFFSRIFSVTNKNHDRQKNAKKENENIEVNWTRYRNSIEIVVNAFAVCDLKTNSILKYTSENSLLDDLSILPNVSFAFHSGSNRHSRSSCPSHSFHILCIMHRRMYVCSISFFGSNTRTIYSDTSTLYVHYALMILDGWRWAKLKCSFSMKFSMPEEVLTWGILLLLKLKRYVIRI